MHFTCLSFVIYNKLYFMDFQFYCYSLPFKTYFALVAKPNKWANLQISEIESQVAIASTHLKWVILLIWIGF